MSCHNHAFSESRLNAKEITLLFRASIFLPLEYALPSLYSSTRHFYFFVAWCRYRNPFSLLVRVIRGFKTAFHHQTLQRSWRERCHCERRRERRRRRLWRGRRRWRRREKKNFSCWKRSTEWLDANRLASFDGLSVNEKASRSARIYRNCIRHWRLQLHRHCV